MGQAIEIHHKIELWADMNFVYLNKQYYVGITFQTWMFCLFPPKSVMNIFLNSFFFDKKIKELQCRLQYANEAGNCQQKGGKNYKFKMTL